MPGSLIAVNVPWAGLGNRLRFTLSAQAVAQAEGRDFAYAWCAGPKFEPDLTELWDFGARQVPEQPADLTEKDDLTALRHEPGWVVRSASVVKGDGTERRWEDALRDLTPTPAIRSAVDRVSITAPFVGVQVRANDLTHERTREASPPEWFIGRMRDFLEADPDARFFLSCDDERTQDRIRSEVPNVTALDDKGGYNTRQGVAAAVVDLHLLARSTHILAPYWSSFAYLAYAMSGGAQPLEDAMRTRPAR